MIIISKKKSIKKRQGTVGTDVILKVLCPWRKGQQTTNAAELKIPRDGASGCGAGGGLVAEEAEMD